MVGKAGGVALAGLVVASVLVADPLGLAPFGPARFAAVSTMTLAAVALGLSTGGRLARGPLVAWGVFLATVVVAATLGVDPLYAWLGTPERHFGALTWALCLGAFFAGQLLARRGGRWVTQAAVAVTGVVGIWAGAEVLGWEPIALEGAGARPVATLGSSAFLGAAMVLLVPVVAGAALDSSRSRRLRLAAAGCGAAGLLALVASGARAAWVGAGVSAFAVLLAHRPRRRHYQLALVGGLLVVFIAAFATGVAGRVPEAFEGDVGGIGGRLDEWRVATAVVAANPVTGVGPEGYRIAFGTHVDDAYEIAHGRQPLPDRAHSAVLDVAATLGFPGLFAYLALLVVVGRHVLRALRRGPPPLVGMAAGLLGYVAQSAFLFPLAELDPLAWMVAGLVVAATMTSAEGIIRRPTRMVPVLVTVATASALVAGGLDVVADRRAKQSLLALAGDSPAPTTPASALRPDALRYHLVDARIHESLGTLSGLTAALEDLDRALRLSPLDPLVRSQRSRLLLERARRSDDPVDIGVARRALEGLAVDDPRNAEVLLRLGLIRSLAGDGTGAETAWLEAERLAPNSAAASTNLAVAYARMGRAADAVAAAERALARDPTSRLARQVVDDLGT